MAAPSDFLLKFNVIVFKLFKKNQQNLEAGNFVNTPPLVTIHPVTIYFDQKVFKNDRTKVFFVRKVLDEHEFTDTYQPEMI